MEGNVEKELMWSCPILAFPGADFEPAILFRKFDKI
jgi:hypothetical protein